MTHTAKITASKITVGTELLTIVHKYLPAGYADRAPAKGSDSAEWRTVATVDGRKITFTDGLRSSSSTGAVVWQTKA
jgi:hypothetical protein